MGEGVVLRNRRYSTMFEATLQAHQSEKQQEEWDERD
jgi:hypothetical protein